MRPSTSSKSLGIPALDYHVTTRMTNRLKKKIQNVQNILRLEWNKFLNLQNCGLIIKNFRNCNSAIRKLKQKSAIADLWNLWVCGLVDLWNY